MQPQNSPALRQTRYQLISLRADCLLPLQQQQSRLAATTRDLLEHRVLSLHSHQRVRVWCHVQVWIKLNPGLSKSATLKWSLRNASASSYLAVTASKAQPNSPQELSVSDDYLVIPLQLFTICLMHSNSGKVSSCAFFLDLKICTKYLSETQIHFASEALSTALVNRLAWSTSLMGQAARFGAAQRGKGRP